MKTQAQIDARKAYKIQWTRNHRDSARASCKRYYLKNLESVSARGKIYRQNNKSKRKAYAKSYHRKHYPLNKEKILTQTRQYAKSHPEIRRKIAINYKRNNPQRYKAYLKASHSSRKARIRGAMVGDMDVSKMIKLMRCQPFFVCAYCQVVFPTSDLTIDHIVPISRGGKHECGNISESCLQCNIGKKAKPLVSFIFANGLGTK